MPPRSTRSVPQTLSKARLLSAPRLSGTELADQAFEALQILLRGFEAAAERDGRDLLDGALARDHDHLYKGLLTALLRLVFVLHAEDRGLLPVDHAVYEAHLSVTGLFNDLQADHGACPDSMSRRFGAWARLVSLFRAVFLGVEHGTFRMSARRGSLFNPHTYPFLEGWGPADDAAIQEPEARAEVRVPRVDDGTVYRVLEKLLVFEGQRLSYRALDVEQIGSVYEALMGYRAVRMPAEAVCMRPDRLWLTESALTRAKAGQLVLQPGAERRRTSSHYTPRALSGPIVRRTLEPLLAVMGKEPASERILNLKICDPAMGSGAFLVEACRFLADHVVAAWTREGKLEALSREHGDPLMHARRTVAQRCLHGVDRNDAAVELARLSLWLVTQARDQPFTFLDHALCNGDSLVGLDLDQIRSFHWKRGKQIELLTKELEAALAVAIELRQQIHAMAESDGRGTHRERERLLRDAQDALDRVRLIGDLVVGAFFAHEKDRDREKERDRRLDLVNAWLREGGPAPDALKVMQAEIKGRIPVFHWMVEYPEVFHAERPDPLDDGQVNRAAYMDAFVGNPPFLRGGDVSGGLGEEYRDWLLALHPHSHGTSDICAHFFRRGHALLGRHGALGLVATNTIAQGETRRTGLRQIIRAGMQLYDVIPSMTWPGAATVEVAVIHGAVGHAARVARPRLGGEACGSINSYLRARREWPDPAPLKVVDGRFSKGVDIESNGFVLTSEQRAELLSRDRRNGECIFLYVGGEDVTSNPAQESDRYVINFGLRSLEEASRWPDLVQIVSERVKSDRDKKRDTDINRRLKELWWRYWADRPGFFELVKPLERILVCANVSKHLCFSFQPQGRVLSKQLYLFAYEEYAVFSTLQSRIHEPWARLLSSSMRTDLRYSASECFETFPFPRPDPRAVIPTLEDSGQRLHDFRARYMIDSNVGLTVTYNRLKDPGCGDPRILELRRLHEEMDRAVLVTYGWTDIDVPPYCPVTGADRQRLERFEDEVIDRLFVLNARRAEEEKLRGATAIPTSRPAELLAGTGRPVAAASAGRMRAPRGARRRG